MVAGVLEDTLQRKEMTLLGKISDIIATQTIG